MVVEVTGEPGVCGGFGDAHPDEGGNDHCDTQHKEGDPNFERDPQLQV